MTARQAAQMGQDGANGVGDEHQNTVPAPRGDDQAIRTSAASPSEDQAPPTPQKRNKPVSRFRIGDRVRLERQKPARGSWSQYAGKVGTVVTGESLGEIGVCLTPKGSGPATAYFLPTELVKIGRAEPTEAAS